MTSGKGTPAGVPSSALARAFKLQTVLLRVPQARASAFWYLEGDAPWNFDEGRAARRAPLANAGPALEVRKRKKVFALQQCSSRRWFPFAKTAITRVEHYTVYLIVRSGVVQVLRGTLLGTYPRVLVCLRTGTCSSTAEHTPDTTNSTAVFVYEVHLNRTRGQDMLL